MKTGLMLLGLALLLGGGANAQPVAGKVYRLVVLTVSVESVELTRAITLPELANQGFVEGKNLVVEHHVGNTSTLPELVQRLIASKPDVIFAISNPAIEAAANATATIPIVMFGADPILQGYAASLGRPGGNITGVTILSSQLDGKRLEMLREAVPSAKRIAVLLPPTSSRAATAKILGEMAAAAGIELLTFDAPTSADYAGAFKAMQGAKAEALVLSATAQYYRDRAQLLALAQDARLPVVCEWPDMARLGCSIGYGPSQQELRKRVADFVGKIFQGAAPSTLPIETPNRFVLAINLKVTRSLGIEVPQSLLLRADEVIE